MLILLGLYMESKMDRDPSPPSSDEVKNEWSYISSPPIHLLDVDRDTFY